MQMDFESKLQKYADVIVRAGLNLQPGQKLVIMAPVQTAVLVRKVAASAYQAGCRFVDVLWNDEQVVLARYQYAPRDSFEEYAAWMPQALQSYVNEGAAVLSLLAADPDLLKDQDPALIQTAMQTQMKHNRAVLEQIGGNQVNWCVISMPVPAWAGKVFPGLPPAEQEARLWEAIFEVVRLNEPDPVAAWKEHDRALTLRCDRLNQKQYRALRYRGPGTDLTVGLPAGHVWMGGSAQTVTGIRFIPNLPTEEVFTLPHKDQVDGVVTASLPLSYGGKLIQNLSLTFRAGRVVDFRADTEQETLEKLLNTDEGARRLGEVALVPYGSPVSRSGLLFYNTLFDENAASHFALGRAYPFTLSGGQDLTPEAFEAAGGNNSMTHVDFMVGSNQLDVDAVLPDGSVEPLMRRGEWAA